MTVHDKILHAPVAFLETDPIKMTFKETGRYGSG